MIKIGFKRCASDRCLYVKSDNDVLTYVLLYVDDLLIICKDIRKITIIKQLLAKEFEMTDIGIASTFLGMHIEQDKKNSTIGMSQEHYLKNALRKFGMEECKTAATPIEKGLHLDFGDVNNCSKLETTISRIDWVLDVRHVNNKN